MTAAMTEVMILKNGGHFGAVRGSLLLRAYPCCFSLIGILEGIENLVVAAKE